MADEVDAAKERDEIPKGRPKKSVCNENAFQATTTELGLTRLQVHEARKVRDFEKANPGAIR